MPATTSGFEELEARVRLLHAIYVAEDETCFYLLHAPSIEAVREAAARAGLRVEHISEAVSLI